MQILAYNVLLVLNILVEDDFWITNEKNKKLLN